MELSPAAQEVLKRYRSHLEIKLSDTFDFPIEETRAVYEFEREHDAREHAEWAAGRLVESFRSTERNAEYELTEPVRKALALRTLTRGYLVKKEWLQHSFQKALELAVKASRDRRSRCS